MPVMFLFLIVKINWVNTAPNLKSKTMSNNNNSNKDNSFKTHSYNNFK